MLFQEHQAELSAGGPTARIHLLSNTSTISQSKRTANVQSLELFGLPAMSMP